MAAKKKVQDSGLSIFDIFEDKTDTNAFENGRWFDITKGSRIKLRAVSSPKVQATRNEIRRPFALREENGYELTAIEENESLLQLLSQAIIVDWKGTIFQDDKGEHLEYSAENAYILLSNPKLAKFAQFLIGLIMDGASFDMKVDEAAEKN